jgi:hypothetical protein
MFFGDRRAAFANLARALRPGGRLTLMVWQALDRNAWIGTILSTLSGGRDLPAPPPGTPGPFALADPDLVTPVLSGAGFTDIAFEAVGWPVRLGADVDDAFRFITALDLARSLLGELDDRGRVAALDSLRAALTAAASADGVHLASNAWLITARR